MGRGEAQGGCGWVPQMAHSQGQPVSASLPGHQLSLVCQSSPWTSEVCIWSPEYCQGCCGMPAPTSAEYRDFYLLILSGYNPCGLGQLCKNWRPWEPPVGGVGLADGSSKGGARCSLHLPGSEEQIQNRAPPLGPP